MKTFMKGAYYFIRFGLPAIGIFFAGILFYGTVRIIIQGTADGVTYFIFALGIVVIILTVWHIYKQWKKSINRKKFIDECDHDRKKWIADLKAKGFKPTKRFIGSGRMLAVDEKMGKWFILNYYINPGNTVLHDISDIRAVEKAINKEYMQSGGGVMLSSGLMLSSSEIRSYYTKLGIVVKLNDKNNPTEYINCFEDENDVDKIMSYLEILIQENAKAAK